MRKATHGYITVDTYGNGFITQGKPAVDQIANDSGDFVFDTDGSMARHVGPEVVQKLFGGQLLEVTEGSRTFIVALAEAE